MNHSVNPALLLCAMLSMPATAQTPAAVEAPATADLVASNTYIFEYDPQSLQGPGADWLREASANSQFVLFGEVHMDFEVPRFASALLGMLHSVHGFSTVVLEQDPVAIEDALAPERRGDLNRLAQWARAYPGLFEFNSDQDLEFIALAGKLLPAPDAIWGIEQTTGAVRYLEELTGLAPDEGARKAASQLLAEARLADPGPDYSVNFLADLSTPAKLQELAQAFNAAADSRAAQLLLGLSISAEIFGYYIRAGQGEFVGLYNNTVREAWMKQQFRKRYREAAAGGTLPRAMFKFGANHMVHGRNLTQAFPTGNLAHELAFMNGMDALGLVVLAFGPGYVEYPDLPAEFRALLPESAPTAPALLDLRPLRRYQRLFRNALEPEAREAMLNTLHGFDAIVLLPSSKPATYELGWHKPD